MDFSLRTLAVACVACVFLQARCVSAGVPTCVSVYYSDESNTNCGECETPPGTGACLIAYFTYGLSTSPSCLSGAQGPPGLFEMLKTTIAGTPGNEVFASFNSIGLVGQPGTGTQDAFLF